MNIAIYGAGGFGKEVACLIDRINRNGGNWNLIGFFDDTKPAGSSVSRYGTVLGNMDALMQINHPLAVAIAINDTDICSPTVSSMSTSRFGGLSLIS